MNALGKQLEKIRETEQQIRMTASARRRYELNRHLNKLRKEYKTAKRYMTEAQHGKRADTAGASE